MRIDVIIISLILATLLVSCGTQSQYGSAAYSGVGDAGLRALPIIGALGGGGIGYFAGGDDPAESAAIGAVAGLGLGTVAQISRNKKNQKFYTTGYEKGRSDAIKTLYWAQRNAEREEEEETPVEYRYYEVPVPAYVTSDGVAIDSHRRVIEVVE